MSEQRKERDRSRLWAWGVLFVLMLVAYPLSLGPLLLWKNPRGLNP